MKRIILLTLTVLTVLLSACSQTPTQPTTTINPSITPSTQYDTVVPTTAITSIPSIVTSTVPNTVETIIPTTPVVTTTIQEEVIIPFEFLPEVIEELKTNPSAEIKGFKLKDNGTLTYNGFEVFNIHTQNEKLELIGSTKSVAYALETTKLFDDQGELMVIIAIISEYRFGDKVDAYHLEGEYVGYSQNEGFLFLMWDNALAFNENTKEIKFLGPNVSEVIAPSYDSSHRNEPIFIMQDGSKKIFKRTNLQPNGIFVDYVE